MSDKKLKRRDFLKGLAVAAGSTALAACAPKVVKETVVVEKPIEKVVKETIIVEGTPKVVEKVVTATPAPTVEDEVIVIQWWDHFLPLEAVNKRLIWGPYSEEHPNVVITPTIFTPEDLGKSLQLAYRSGQAPDIHALAGVGAPVRFLQKEGWFTPLEPYIDEEWKSRFPPGTFLEGLTVFDGEVYTFPLFSTRQHCTLNWYNKQLMEEAGFDPEVGPKTYDEVREAARKITEKGGGTVFGLILPLQMTSRIGAQWVELAQAAGAPGEIDWKTGEYAYHTDPFIESLEFLLAIQSDGSVSPASSSMNARNARARWVTGIAGMFLDGPWNAGVLLSSFPEFQGKEGVTQIPVPSADRAAYIYHGSRGGDYWISSQSKHPEIAADILKRLNSKEYQIGLAERMDQIPLDAAAVEKANVTENYKKGMRFFQEIVRIGPSPLIKNPIVADVYAEMRDIHPNHGEIMQGAFSGDISDYKAALKEYSDKLSAERERAIKAVRAAGKEVSLDDRVFPIWEPGKDYTQEYYDELRS